jgi:hypothetical protein
MRLLPVPSISAVRIKIKIFFLLLSALLLVRNVTFAFVSCPPARRQRQQHHFFISVVPIITAATSTKVAMKKKKNFADEILDALDTMAGVSPLTETDLKRSLPPQPGSNTNAAGAVVDSIRNSKSASTRYTSTNRNQVDQQQQQQQQQADAEWLLERQAQRELVAPPKDALQKPSVSIFFALLGIVPCLLLLYAVSFGGIKPFGL